MKKVIELEFYECEHEGDLDYYIDDIVKSGGNIKKYRINYEAEIGYVTIEVNDFNKFKDKFKETEAFDFLN